MYTFAGYRLDESLYKLLREDDSEVALTPKEFDLLLYLVVNADRIVSYEEIREELWPGILVTPATLRQLVTCLRRALGPASAHLRTIRSRGLTFEGPIEHISVGEAEEGGARPAIAILPLENRTGDDGRHYLGPGLAEDLGLRIQRWRFISVVDPRTTNTYAGTGRSLEEIGRELRAQYVVAGSFEEAGQTITLRVQLSDLESGGVVLSERFDVSFDELRDTLDALSTRICGALNVHAQDRAARRPEGKGVVDAWDLTMQAWWHYYQFSREGHAAASELLARAVELDSGCVPAWYTLSFLDHQALHSGWVSDVPATILHHLECGETATRLDPLDPYAHVALGLALTANNEAEKAQHSLERAIELNPNLTVARAALAQRLAYVGQPDEARVHIVRAMQQSPKDPYTWWLWQTQAGIELVAGNYERAVAAAQRSDTLQPDFLPTVVLLAASHGLVGQEEKARLVGKRLMNIWPAASLSGMRVALESDDPEYVERMIEGLRVAGLA